MSFGDDTYSTFSDDQVHVNMISQFDDEPWPGLYDTTRSDIFKMCSWPCFKCDGQFKGMPKQMQFGPPFAPPCAESESAKYNVISQWRALYPEDGVKCMSCGTPKGPTTPQLTSVAINNAQVKPNAPTKEGYQTTGNCNCPDRAYVSATGRQPGCSCLGLVGCRKLPEAGQAGVYPGVNGNIEGFTIGGKDSMSQMILMLLIVVLVYLGYIHAQMCVMKSEQPAAVPGVK